MHQSKKYYLLFKIKSSTKVKSIVLSIQSKKYYLEDLFNASVT